MLTLVTLSGVKLTGCGGFDLTGMILLYSEEHQVLQTKVETAHQKLNESC